MLSSQSVAFVDSDYTAHFRGAMAISGGSLYADLQLASGAASVGPHKCLIKSIRLLSLQNLDWRVEVWDRSVPNATGDNLNNHGLLYWRSLNKVTAASQYATTFAYAATGLDVPYVDRDGLGQLHVKLVNEDGNTAKSAGDVGAVHLRFGIVYAA